MIIEGVKNLIGDTEEIDKYEIDYLVFSIF